VHAVLPASKKKQVKKNVPLMKMGRIHLIRK
jgi:hypothetical protein